eukprot:scaffold9688_cov60-Attheya_sp.AAC.4
MKILRGILTLFLLHGLKNNGTLANPEDGPQSHADTNDRDLQETKRYIVKFSDDKSMQKMLSKRSINTVMRITPLSLGVMMLTEAELQEMDVSAEVQYIEEDGKVFLPENEIESDVSMQDVSMYAEGTPYGIDMVKALEVDDSKASNRKLCIIDSGYSRGHPDLPDPELPESRGMVTGARDGGAGNWDSDTNGHGSHVAGTIAAIGGNNRGVKGVIRNGQLNLHIVRVFGKNGWAWKSSLLNALDECIMVGSNVVSMSLGGGGYSRTEKEGFQKAFDRGILIFAAAGNDGSTGFSYPASYDAVISVGAVDSRKRLASFSQKNNQVELVGPGVNVESTWTGGGYKTISGTSMSTPHVSAVAALVWSHFPDVTNAEMRGAMRSSAESLGGGTRNNDFGYGLARADLLFDYLKETQTQIECASGESLVEVSLVTDFYGEETSWSLRENNGMVLVSGSELSGNKRYANSLCIPKHTCFTFTINDGYGDGVCCSYGQGFFSLTVDGLEVKSGSDFGGSSTYTSCGTTLGDDDDYADETPLPGNCDDGESEFTLSRTLGGSSQGTSWAINMMPLFTVVAEADGYSGISGAVVVESICLGSDRCYRFRIEDSGWDGMEGSYSITYDNEVVREEGTFSWGQGENTWFGDCLFTRRLNEEGQSGSDQNQLRGFEKGGPPIISKNL